MSAVGLPVHEQGHPIGRRVVADHLDQGGRERVRDGRRGAEHGGLPPAWAVTGGHHRQDDERAGAAPDHDPAQIGGHLLPAARVGEEEETGEPHGDGTGADPLADGDGEAEIGPEDEDEEQQFHGQDRLHHGEPPVVQREGLQQEGADHEAETQQPHPSTDGVRHQAQAHGGLLRGVFDAHALEHAGQRVRQGRCYGKDIDHRLADQFNGECHRSRRRVSAGTQVLSGACCGGIAQESCANGHCAPDRAPPRRVPALIPGVMPQTNVAIGLRLRTSSDNHSGIYG